MDLLRGRVIVTILLLTHRTPSNAHGKELDGSILRNIDLNEGRNAKNIRKATKYDIPWMSDSEVFKCNLCNNHFTLINR
jgi:hypothetical protein